MYLFSEKVEFVTKQNELIVTEIIVMISSYIGKSVEQEKQNLEKIKSIPVKYPYIPL